MSAENTRLLAAYITAHTDDHEEGKAVGHSLMNRVMSNSFSGAIGDSAPSLEGEPKEKFFKILNGQEDKDTMDFYKRSIIHAGAIMSGRLKDPTGGADYFTSGKSKDAIHSTKNYSFSKSSPTEGVSSGKIKSSSKGRKKLKA